MCLGQAEFAEVLTYENEGRGVSLGFIPGTDYYATMDTLKELAVTAFGSFLGAWLAFLFGKRQDNAKALEKAAVDFRDAVHAALSGVFPLASEWPKDADKYFRDVFLPMQLAVSRFRPFIPPTQQAAFDHAWKLYRLGDEGREIDVQLYHHYMAFGSNPDYKKRLHNNVSALLKFAE